MLFGNFAESQSKDFNQETIDEEGSAEDYGYLSDSDLEDDEDKDVDEDEDKDEDEDEDEIAKSKARPSDPLVVPSGPEGIDCEKYKECVDGGKVAKILDVAFVTWV